MPVASRLLVWVVAIAAVAAGCSPPGNPVSRPQARPADSERDEFVKAFQTAFLAGDLPRAAGLLRVLTQRPDATAKEFATLGAILIELGQHAEAEAQFRSAIAKDPHDDSIAAALGKLLLLDGRANAALPVLDARVRGRPVAQLDIELLEVLAEAQTKTGDRADACRTAVLGILVSPSSQASWSAARACSPDQIAVALAALPSPAPGAGFPAILALGPPNGWSAASLDDSIAAYQAFATSLEHTGASSLATRYLEVCGIVLVADGVALARHKRPAQSLNRFALAEQISGLEALPLEFHLAALRDMIIGYVRTRRYLEGIAVAHRLFELCHSDPSEPDRCPVRALADPMFANAVIVEGMPAVLPIHMAHLGLVLRDARASVSFDMESGHPRYKDGHDFVGETVQHLTPGSATGVVPYATTTPEEDRVLCWSFVKDASHAARLRAELAAGRFELPVKILLSELGVAAMMGGPGVPPVVDSGTFADISLAELRRGIASAPPGSIPEPTLIAFEVAERAMELYRRIAPWIQPVSGGTITIRPKPGKNTIHLGEHPHVDDAR